MSDKNELIVGTKVFVTLGDWLPLSQELKNILKEKFGLRRSEGTKVEDNRVISDGHTPEDLMATLNADKFIEYLAYTGEPVTFDQLFELVIVKLTKEVAGEDGDAQDGIKTSAETGDTETVKKEDATSEPEKTDPVAPTSAETTEPKKANEPEMVDHVLTQEDLDENPELIKEGLKVGDTIQYPKEEKADATSENK